MMRAGDFIVKQSKTLLANKQYAIFAAVLLSLLPFASWLSVSLVALVALRKGAKAGFEVMLPAAIIHSVPLMTVVPLASALINSLVSYIPCFVAALVLRRTTNWSMVFGVFFIQALVGFTSLQILAPNFIVDQFAQFKNMLGQYQDYQQLLEANTEGLNSLVLAQLFFGVQLLSVVVSATISLMFARSIQAKLFLPDGFKKEVREFRSGKLSFLILIAVAIASYYEIPVAINMLPIVLSYFFMSGFNLAYFVLARKRQARIVILLFLLILLKPSVILLVYIVMGFLDSLFNLRLYLPVRLREST